MNNHDIPCAEDDLAHADMKPQEFERCWLPFRPNGAFKKQPKLFASETDIAEIRDSIARVLRVVDRGEQGRSS